LPKCLSISCFSGCESSYWESKGVHAARGFIPNAKLKLLEQVREVTRFKHDSLRTGTTYRQWIKRFVFFHGKWHPREMGALEVETFLSDLAVTRYVAALHPEPGFQRAVVPVS